MQVLLDLLNGQQSASQEYSRERTREEDLINSQACAWRTVGEFLEKSSEVRAYTSIVVNPAPNRITRKLVVRAVALAAIAKTLLTLR